MERAGLRFCIITGKHASQDRSSAALGAPTITQAELLLLCTVPRPCVPCRTYSTLVSHVKGSSRLDQVVSWVGGADFDGPLIFDECHKSKNFVPGKEAQSTRVQAPPWARCLSSNSRKECWQACCSSVFMALRACWSAALMPPESSILLM